MKALVLAAMPEEAAPLLAASTTSGPHRADNRFHALRLGAHDVTLGVSGIGLVNAASTAATALALQPYDLIVSIGSAGGIRGNVDVGDVAVASTLRYSSADARAFGYEIGQIPGMPTHYDSDPRALELLTETVQGPFVSGDMFVAGALLESVTALYPDVIAVDMESTAIAQVAYRAGVPFVSIRGISDLCGPSAAHDHSATLDDVAGRSAAALLTLLERY